MGILSSVPIVGKIIDKGLDIVDDFVKDKDQAEKLKTEIKKQIENNTHEQEIAELKSQARIVTAEAKGESWLQRNWRPMLMLTVILIIANNYILFPYLHAFTAKVKMLELPKGLWALLNIGVGGYVGGRTVEKFRQRTKNNTTD